MKSFTDTLSLLLIVMLTCFHVFPEKVGANYGNLLTIMERGFYSSYQPYRPPQVTLMIKGPVE